MRRTGRRSITGIFPSLGVVGSILACLAILIVSLTYRGKASEHFSLLNHFISELGQVGVSRDARLFNAALVASGILFVPFCVGLGLTLRGWWGYLGMAAGSLAGLFLAGVGLFPMNHQSPHITAAMWFFRFGLATTLCFGIAILRQPGGAVARVSRAASAFSLLAFAVYAVFLVIASIPGVGGGDPLDPAALANRPAFWLLAVLEWGVFFSTVLWFFGVSLLLMVGGRGGWETRRGKVTRADSQS
jgi:hypothetical membrane protein